MSNELRNLQDNAVAWHIKRFPDALMEHVALKVCEESGEVANAVNGKAGLNSATSGGSVPEECADVVISMMILLGRYFPAADLFTEIGLKLAILSDPNSTHRAALKEP